jgi:hypothetical protein
MLITTCYLGDLRLDSLNDYGSVMALETVDTQLTKVVFSASKNAANIVDESSVAAARINLAQKWFVVFFKVHF